MLRIKKRLSWPLVAFVVVALLILATGVALAGNGPGGPGGTTSTTDPGTGGGGGGSVSDTGTLFGDLYVLLRYLGDDGGVGGEPWLSTEPGWQVVEVGVNPDETPIYGLQLAEEPSECVQPVASYERWGDIWHPVTLRFACTGATDLNEPCTYVYDPEVGDSSQGIPAGTQFGDLPADWTCPECEAPKDTFVPEPVYDDPDSVPKHQIVNDEGEYEWIEIPTLQILDEDGNPLFVDTYNPNLDKNRIPLVLVYTVSGPAGDSWSGTEATIGLLMSTPVVDEATGELFLDIDPYFIQPGGTWIDPNNPVPVTYEDGVLWTDLIQPVDFGRISVSRSPEAVLQSAFDEVINSINSPDTVAIEIDSAGRLLLTKNVYDEYLVDPMTGDPILLGTVKKAIDSPLENLALYVKLLQDGHLVTPGWEREPIDRSPSGGIPIWKEIAMEDGPSNELRPTIDIQKMRDWGFANLVDVEEEYYYAYYAMESAGSTTTTTNGKGGGKPPAQTTTTGMPDQDPDLVPVYKVVEESNPTTPTAPPDYPADEEPVVWTGLIEDDGGSAAGADFAFAASFLAAAADKTSDIGVDFIVYLNSILGINQVVGEYADNPVYFDFSGVSDYNRSTTFGARGEVVTKGGSGLASTYNGKVWVLQGSSPTWTETEVPLFGGPFDFDDLGQDPATHFPTDPPSTAANNILGFTQMADDDLSVIEFIHTYQIPERR